MLLPLPRQIAENPGISEIVAEVAFLSGTVN
jgi:hypothetical protein